MGDKTKADFWDRFLTAFALAGTVFSLLFVTVLARLGHALGVVVKGSDAFWYLIVMFAIVPTILLVVQPMELWLEIKNYGLGKSIVSYVVLFTVIGVISFVLTRVLGYPLGQIFIVPGLGSILALPVAIICKLLYNLVARFKTVIYLVAGLLFLPVIAGPLYLFWHMMMLIR